MTKRTPRTYPDFVILCLVLQILIKLLLRVELNAVYFKLFANLERQGSGWQEAESVSTGSAPAISSWLGREVKPGLSALFLDHLKSLPPGPLQCSFVLVPFFFFSPSGNSQGLAAE